jgi:excisionase family DNA binding protein
MYTLLTEQELAKQLSVSLASVRRWRINGRGPLFVKVGASVRYGPEDVETWLGELATGGSDSFRTPNAVPRVMVKTR